MRCASLVLCFAASLYSAPVFKVHLSPSVSTGPVDGRLIIVISKESKGEPRFDVQWGLQTAQIFAIDVEGLSAGTLVSFDDSAAGHPIGNLSALPPGKYNVQAVLNIYETVRRADGHVLKLPIDNGEGQQWNTSPGNLFSKPVMIEITPN